MNSLLQTGSKSEQWMMIIIVFSTILLNGLGIFMIFFVTKTDEVKMDTYNERLVPLSHLAVVSKLTENTRVEMLSALSLKDEGYIEQAQRNMAEINKQLIIYEKSYMTSEELESYKKFQFYWKEYCSFVDNNIHSIRTGKLDDAWDGLKKGEIPYNQASQELTKLIRSNNEIVARFNNK